MAQVVGEKMASLGAGMQVIAVSHLPQIAALADAHYLVEKTAANNRTGTSVRCLNEQERVNELARMVGGAGGMDSGLAHAANMLAEARKWKLSAVTCGQACP
jgi:DNA repair protein RecN (Recombination protein N)